MDNHLVAEAPPVAEEAPVVVVDLRLVVDPTVVSVVVRPAVVAEAAIAVSTPCLHSLTMETTNLRLLLRRHLCPVDDGRAVNEHNADPGERPREHSPALRRRIADGLRPRSYDRDFEPARPRQ